MKRTCKMLSLLLVAVMALTLLPHAAKADPPQDDPSHQHNWVVTYDQKATCTEAGRKTWRCTACGRTYTETYKALGHDWDEGKVTTEPHLFTPGERTYTCKRDHSHTYTEEIDPAPWLFATLEGVEMDFETFDVVTRDLTPIVITEQPKGGSITRDEDETVPLTCAASGGTGEYTYEWYSKRIIKISGINWASNIWNGLRSHGEQTEPGFDAEEGDRRYWCLVTDSAGNTAVTDLVDVTYKVRIAKQPDNMNLQTGKVTLTCEAADGSGSYTYRWIDNQDNEIGFGASVDADEIGDYMCIVTDDVTGEEVHSDACVVYSEPPFRLEGLAVSAEELWPEEVGNLSAVFSGGVQPYEVRWEKDGEPIETREGTTLNGMTPFYAESDGAGVYTVHATDAMGEVLTASATRRDRQIPIVEQPEGGTLPDHGYRELRLTIADETGLFYLELFRNGQKYAAIESSSLEEKLSVWRTGEYYFRITNLHNGHYAISDTVTVKNEELRIKSQTQSGEIWDAKTPIYPAVTAEGGRTPYTYTWTRCVDGEWFQVGSNNDWLEVKEPGEYKCTVKDRDGAVTESRPIPITYTASVPFITEQPKGGIMQDGEDSYRLTCSAVCGTDQLRYEWYEVTTGERKIRRLFASDTQRIDVTKSRIYYCRVTNLITGEYAESNRVRAAKPLKVAASGYQDYVTTTYGNPNEIDGHGVVATDDSRGVYYFEFEGGYAPYRISAYAANFAGSGKDVPVETKYLYKDEGTTGMALPKEYPMLWTDDTIAYQPYQYYFVITDGSGQEITFGK